MTNQTETHFCCGAVKPREESEERCSLRRLMVLELVRNSVSGLRGTVTGIRALNLCRPFEFGEMPMSDEGYVLQHNFRL